jgi:hypothetical protein
VIAAAAAFIAFAAAALQPPAPSTSPSAASASVTWQGVTLGEPASAVTTRLGPPASRRKAVMGTYLLDYRALDGAGTLSLTEGDGVITGIRLIAADPASLRTRVLDAFGVALGDSGDRLTELRGQPQRYDDEGGSEFTSYYGRASEVRWAYGLRDGVVFSIGVILPYRVVRASGAAVRVATPRPSNVPTPLPPDASGLDRAILVTQDELAADPQFELSFVRRIPCAANDHWTPVAETIINAHRKNYSRIDAICPPTGEKRSFYFDITSVFGRGDR